MEPTTRRNSLNVPSSSPSRELSLVVEAYFVIPSFAPCTSILLHCRITTSIVLPFKKARSRKRNLIINLEPGFGSIILMPAIDIPLKALAAFSANEKKSFSKKL